MSTAAATVRNVTKLYGTGEARVVALDGVDLEIAAGEFTAIMGPSGSGKSTLMHCLAGLDTPTSGNVILGDQDLAGLDDDRLTLLRRHEVGFVFQAYNLIPTLTARENIELPLLLGGTSPDAALMALLVQTFRLKDRLTHRPGELSGGQQQRVALARALIGRPRLVFADEPTGNLDSRSGAELLDLLRRVVDDFEQTVVMVTHDPTAAARADRVLFLADGRIVDELRSPTVEQVIAQLASLDGRRV